jgi:cytochrome P450
VDVEIGCVKVPAGANLLVLVASANHDPAVFPEPETLDIHRPNAKEHIGFGYGAHICLGAPLARLEVRIMFEQILARFPDMEFAAPYVRQRNNFVNGIASMPVRYTSERARVAVAR